MFPREEEAHPLLCKPCWHQPPPCRCLLPAWWTGWSPCLGSGILVFLQGETHTPTTNPCWGQASSPTCWTMSAVEKTPSTLKGWLSLTWASPGWFPSVPACWRSPIRYVEFAPSPAKSPNGGVFNRRSPVFSPLAEFAGHADFHRYGGFPRGALDNDAQHPAASGGFCLQVGGKSPHCSPTLEDSPRRLFQPFLAV